MSQTNPTVLVLDLRVNRDPPQICSHLAALCRVEVVSDPALLPARIARTAPSLLCFDFDFPDAARLRVLRRVKRNFPAVPILMLTEQHSEALAVWAFRTGARDYVIKPVSRPELVRRVAALLQLRVTGGEGTDRENLLWPAPIPMEMCLGGAGHRSTAPARSYVEAHFQEKITLDCVARLCGVGRYEFSRLFRRQHGVTFREFLVRYRIRKACAMLRNPNASVTDTAFGAGFNDLSYFDRTFRRYVGVSPSDYRLARAAH